MAWMFKTSMTRLLLRIGRCNDTVSPDFTGKSEILSLLDNSTVDPLSEQVMDCLTYWANVIHNILSKISKTEKAHSFLLLPLFTKCASNDMWQHGRWRASDKAASQMLSTSYHVHSPTKHEQDVKTFSCKNNNNATLLQSQSWIINNNQKFVWMNWIWFLA